MKNTLTMKKVLIDSDVILDVLTARIPFDEASTQMLKLAETKQIHAYTTPVAISNIYNIISKYRNHNAAIKSLEKLLSALDVLDMDKNVVMNAIHSKFKDFEDALQYFSSVKNGRIDAIITRNTKDYKLSSIPVFTPDTFVSKP